MQLPFTVYRSPFTVIKPSWIRVSEMVWGEKRHPRQGFSLPGIFLFYVRFERRAVKRRGLIQVYTGDGKGKTTAAIGLACRACGHNLKVCYVCFHKDPKRWGCGEVRVLKNLGVDVYEFAKKTPRFYKNIDPDDIRKECLEGIKFIKKV